MTLKKLLLVLCFGCGLAGCSIEEESRETKYLRLQSEKESLQAEMKELENKIWRTINRQIGAALWNKDELDPLLVKAKESFGAEDLPCDFLISRFKVDLGVTMSEDKLRTATLNARSEFSREYERRRLGFQKAGGGVVDVSGFLEPWNKAYPIFNTYIKEAASILGDQLVKRTLKEAEIRGEFAAEIDALKTKIQEKANIISAMEKLSGHNSDVGSKWTALLDVTEPIREYARKSSEPSYVDRSEEKQEDEAPPSQAVTEQQQQVIDLSKVQGLEVIQVYDNPNARYIWKTYRYRMPSGYSEFRIIHTTHGEATLSYVDKATRWYAIHIDEDGFFKLVGGAEDAGAPADFNLKIYR